MVDLLHDEGLISLDVQYIDGTKIESVANKYTFVLKGSVEKNREKLMAKVDGVLKEAEEVLAEENATEQPEEITKEDLQKRTDRILEKMDNEGVADKKLRKAVTKVKEESLPKLDEYDKHLEILGERNSYSSEIVADSGYGSERNYEFLFANGMTPYVKYNMFLQGIQLFEMSVAWDVL